jgi:hypothetical protein
MCFQAIIISSQEEQINLTTDYSGNEETLK